MADKSKLNFEALDANKKISARNYWKNRLGGCEWHTYFNHPSAGALTEGDYTSFTVNAPAAVYESLQGISGSPKADHVILLAALSVLLQKYTAVSDIIIFTPCYPTNNRDDAEKQLIPVRMKDFAHQRFVDFLSGLKHDLISDCKYGDFPFNSILHTGGLVFDKTDAVAMYVDGLQKYEINPLNLSPCLVFSFNTGASLTLTIQYATARFNGQYIQQMARQYFNCLYTLICNKEACILQADWVSDHERRELLFSFNETDTTYPRDETIVSLLKKQTEKASQHIVLRMGDVCWTYHDLWEISDLIAFHLQKLLGVKHGDRVGLLLEREPYFIASVIAVMKCGATFVPIDTDYPVDRINTIVNRSHLSAIILRTAAMNAGVQAMTGVVNLDKVALVPDYSFNFTPVEISSTDVAYVLYTSGSTGMPKGVMIEHRSLVNYIYWAAAFYLQGKKAAMPLYTSVAFDLTVTSVFVPLITGNEIIIYNETNTEQVLKDIFSDNRAHVIKLTPSHLKIIRDSHIIPVSNNTPYTFIVGGEELETRLAKDIYARFSGKVEIYNEYGPTEATVGCMIYRYNPADEQPTVPIGKPVNNTQIYLLDAFLKPVPFGMNGEIYISGDGVAKGYWADEGLTREKFPANPFVPEKRMYKTGDLACREFNGNIFFKGRMDEQVKIRGFRVELGEIEVQLLAYQHIKDAVVLVKEKAGEKYLVAWYTSPKEIDSNVLREYLLNKLPYYMVPFYFVFLPQMPLTENGKINRKSLKDPEIQEGKYEAPSGEIQEQLVEMWSQILQIEKERISVNKSFFELGGNSMKIVQLNKMINDTFKMNCSIPTMFRYSTIAAFTTFMQTGNQDIEKQKSEAKKEVSDMQDVIENLFKS